MNKQESTIAGVVVGTIGIGVSVAVGVAVVSWLGVVAGIAALLGAYLTHLIVSRMTRAEEAFPGALSDHTRTWLSRAESGAQALGLLLVSPEMMRR